MTLLAAALPSVRCSASAARCGSVSPSWSIAPGFGIVGRLVRGRWSLSSRR